MTCRSEIAKIVLIWNPRWSFFSWTKRPFDSKLSRKYRDNLGSKFFPFRVDPFSEGACAKKQSGSYRSGDKLWNIVEDLSCIQPPQSVRIYALRLTFFAWHFILNGIINFWLTISYQGPFVFTVSLLCFQIFSVNLILWPKMGLTHSVSRVMWSFGIFLLENIFCFSLWILNYW